MRRRAILLAGPAALLTAPVAAQVSDYRLPPAPTPTPRVVGPLPDTPVPRASPAPTPAPAPAPTATAPPVATPTPRASAPTVNIPAPTPTPRPTLTAPAARTTAPLPASAPSPPVPTTAATATPTPVASPSPTAAPFPSFTAPETAAPEKPAGSWWPWIAAVFALAGAAVAGLFWLRRRVGPLGPLVVPEIERPRVPDLPPPVPQPELLPAAPEATPEPAPQEAQPEPHPLHIAIELRKLTLTLMNASLGYRLTLTNAGSEPLAEITVAADLIGAHKSMPREVQLAGPGTELPTRHLLAGLAPGESGDVSGELRLPLNELRPISQGRALLFVPLARVRVGAEGQEPRYFTLVAGQPSPSGTGAIQPVRLDLGPRVYDGLAGRAF